MELPAVIPTAGVFESAINRPSEKEEAPSGKEEVPSEKEGLPDPQYISYLLDPSTKHTIFFLVGDPSFEEQVEKIGAVKLKLLAHSMSLRLMLEESELAERGVVRITDIQPKAFRNLLRFMYGYNNVPTLTMEEAVDLVYPAEKYLVDELKNILAAHISSVLTVDNVFPPLQRPECFQLEELKNAILKIVQYETKSLFSKDEFLQLNDFGLQMILEQNALGVPEIDVWRAVLKWAKHNALSDEALELRGKLERHLKYIRFCTLALEDFAKEVVVTGILTKHEVFSIINAVGSNTKQDDLITVCNEIEARSLVHAFVESQELKLSIPRYHSEISKLSSQMFIVTKDRPLVITSATCKSNSHKWQLINKGLEYKCKCQISVEKITDCANLISAEPKVEFVFEEFVEYGKEFIIPFRVADVNVKLLPHSVYKIGLRFSEYSMFNQHSGQDAKFNNDDLTVVLGNFTDDYNNKWSGSHIMELAYKIITQV